MKKYILFLFVLMIVPFIVYSAGQPEEVSSVRFVDGIVEYFEGEVTVNDLPAEFGMKVPFGAVIKTAPAAYCEVVFDKGNVFRIMEATVAEIKLSVDNPEIRIEKGAFAALFTKLNAFTSDVPFQVRTQTTVAGVRGTAFFVKVNDPDTTYICICNGELEVSKSDGTGLTDFSSGHHKASWYKNQGGKIEVSDAPLLYHNDEEMDLLAARINKKIPWAESSSQGY
jgi:hypothetical protein